MYYSAWDCQLNQYFHTGRNSKTKKECEENITSYLIDGSAEDEAEKKRLLSLPFKEIASMFEVEIHEHNQPIKEVE